MDKNKIKELLPTKEFDCHINLYGSNRYWHQVSVKLGTKSRAMEIINNAGGNSQLITCSNIYCDTFVVEK